MEIGYLTVYRLYIKKYIPLCNKKNTLQSYKSDFQLYK